jgi:hypothetical protein
MPTNTQPSTQDLVLRAAFELGCRALKNHLDANLALISDRLDHACQEWNKRDAQSAALVNNLLEDISHASGLLKPLPDSPLTDNTQFIETVDELGTPEAKYLAQQLRRQKKLAHNAKVNGDVSIRISDQRHIVRTETEELKSGQEMPFQDPLLALRLLLEKERELFSAKDRWAFSDRIDNLDGPAKDCASIKLRLDAVAKSLDPLYTLVKQLERLLRVFKQLNEETERLLRIESEIKRLENETTSEAYDAQALRIDRPQLAMEAILRELEGKLASEKGILAQNVAILKEHFALDKRLITTVAAILNEIQFLCGDVVKIRIEEIPEWEIGLAEQGRNRARMNLPERSVLSGIQPALIDEAFRFLKEHEDFLMAYDLARRARITIAGIEKDILATQGQFINKKRVARATKNERTAERKHHKARLEKTAEETTDEIDELTAILFEELEELRKGAGIADPLEKVEPGKFWAEIEKGFGCGALEDAEKELDGIEPTIQKLDMKIS